MKCFFFFILTATPPPLEILLKLNFAGFPMTILGVDMHIFWNCTTVIVLQLFFLDSANYYVACWASLFLVKEDRHPDHTHDNHLSNYVTEESECTQIHFCSQVGILKCIMVEYEQENQFYIPSMIK